MAKRILIVCGEASGDLNAANLAKKLFELQPSLKISAVGGTLLKDAGAQILYDIKELSAIGIFDVLKKLPKFFALKKIILQKISQEKPDAVILVDFSGFNLRLAKAINRAVPVIYYTSPQVWASRRRRINTIKKYVSKMIVLFNFEVDFYKKHGLSVDFTGHPLLDIVRPTMGKPEFLAEYGLYETRPTVALLPGSRKQEIRNILPIMLKSAVIIDKEMKNIQFVIAKSTQVDWQIYNQLSRNVNIDLKIIEGKTYDCLSISDFALVASGTATLETAIMEKPFAVIYKMNLLNYLLYRPQVKAPYIGMANIIAGSKIVPEFIQFRATPERISGEVIKILRDASLIAQIKNNLSRVKSSLGENGASLRAAQLILDFLK